MKGDAPARVAVITVGDELLSGETADSNFRKIATAVTGVGLIVSRQRTVPDEISEISDAIRWSLGRDDVIILTGGLGPTHDDLTRESVADATGRPLRRREELEVVIRGFFEALGPGMPEENLKQADLPEGANAIPPAGGTAPGLELEHSGSLIFALPGVPREMLSMLRSHVIPQLGKRFSSSDVQVTRRLMTFGCGESDVSDMLSDIISSGNVRYGFLAKVGTIEVKLTVSTGSPEEASRILDEEEETCRTRLGSLVYGVDEETMEGVTGALLQESGLSLAVAESATAGMIAAMITKVPGSSNYFKGGVVSYSADSKVKILGIDPDLISKGTVSRAVTEAMACSAMRLFGSDMAVSVTGVAGPAGGGESKPVGTICLALAHGAAGESWEVRLPGDRAMVRNIAAVAALNAVRLHVQFGGSNAGILPGSWLDR